MHNSVQRPAQTDSLAVFVPNLALLRLSVFRTSQNLVGCQLDHGVWIRSLPPNDRNNYELMNRVWHETAAQLYQVTSARELIPSGCLVPTMLLPDGPWLPMHELLPVNWPIAGFAGSCKVKVPLRLVRDEIERECTVIELELTRWAQEISATPQIRLARWEFAASPRGRVLVRGLPLPSLPGPRFYEREGILVPAGFRWKPEVTPAVLRTLMGWSSDRLILWRAETNTWDEILEDAFVPARRANVCQTLLELASRQVDQ